MKSILSVISCAFGGIIIGAFADKLGTTYGIVMFSLGIVLIAVSSYIIYKD